MSEELVKLAIENGVAEVTLNRPAKRNALSRELIAQLTSAVASVRSAPSARLLVLSAAGTSFCAGMDLDEMQLRASQPNSREEWEKDSRGLRDLLVAILQLDVPTLAVVEGPAIAGGFGLVLAFDIVLASTAARFAMPETIRGISPAIVSPLLIYRIGPGAATPILLTGRMVDAQEAHRLGISQFLADAESVAAKRREIVNSILAGAPGALAVTKKLVRSFAMSTLLEQLEAGRKVSAAARDTSEAREGIAAFQEKRPTNWSRGAG
jgi:methylglutaconyl-CoA hydratase